MAWLAPFMMKRAPSAMAQNLPMTSLSPMNGIVVEDALLDETVRPLGIVVIGEIADLDVVGVDQRLQEADARMQRHRMLYRRVWSIHGSLLSGAAASLNARSATRSCHMKWRNGLRRQRQGNAEAGMA